MSGRAGDGVAADGNESPGGRGVNEGNGWGAGTRQLDGSPAEGVSFGPRSYARNSFHPGSRGGARRGWRRGVVMPADRVVCRGRVSRGRDRSGTEIPSVRVGAGRGEYRDSGAGGPSLSDVCHRARFEPAEDAAAGSRADVGDVWRGDRDVLSVAVVGGCARLVEHGRAFSGGYADGIFVGDHWENIARDGDQSRTLGPTRDGDFGARGCGRGGDADAAEFDRKDRRRGWRASGPNVVSTRGVCGPGGCVRAAARAVVAEADEHRGGRRTANARNGGAAFWDGGRRGAGGLLAGARGFFIGHDHRRDLAPASSGADV